MNDVNITTVRFHGGHLFGIRERESRNGKRTRVYTLHTYIHVPPLHYVYAMAVGSTTTTYTTMIKSKRDTCAHAYIYKFNRASLDIWIPNSKPDTGAKNGKWLTFLV